MSCVNLASSRLVKAEKDVRSGVQFQEMLLLFWLYC